MEGDVRDDRSGPSDARSDRDDAARGIGLPSATTPPRTNESFTTGVILLLLVVLLWTGSNFLTNYQLTSGYDKPFAVTYLNTSSFALYLVPFAVVLRSRSRRAAHKHARLDRRASPAQEPAAFSELWTKLGFYLPDGSLQDLTRRGRSNGAQYSIVPGQDHLEQAQTRHVDQDCGLPPLNLPQTVVLAAHFMIVWFLANYCLNVALKLTSVASATTLSSASGFFTLAIGAVAGVEAFTFPKLGAVTMTFVGVLMVTRADSDPGTTPTPGEGTREPTAPFLGDMLALASAGFYAVYVVLLKVRIVHESRVSMPLFFGFVGLLNIIAMWPVGLLLHLTGVEELALPHGKDMWAGVLINMAITVVSDMAYLVAMLKSSPLVATVGLSLTIPLAILGDTLRGAHSGGTQAFVGAAVVLASFVAIGLADRASADA